MCRSIIHKIRRDKQAKRENGVRRIDTRRETVGEGSRGVVKHLIQRLGKRESGTLNRKQI